MTRPLQLPAQAAAAVTAVFRQQHPELALRRAAIPARRRPISPPACAGRSISPAATPMIMNGASDRTPVAMATTAKAKGTRRRGYDGARRGHR